VQEVYTRPPRMPSGGSRRSTPTKGATATQRQDWMERQDLHSAVPPAGELVAEANTSADHGTVFACVVTGPGEVVSHRRLSCLNASGDAARCGAVATDDAAMVDWQSPGTAGLLAELMDADQGDAIMTLRAALTEKVPSPSVFIPPGTHGCVHACELDWLYVRMRPILPSPTRTGRCHPSSRLLSGARCPHRIIPRARIAGARAGGAARAAPYAGGALC